MKHLLVMAAGTGGHVIPGLAVAAEMKRRGWSVSWLGTPNGFENKLVPKAGIALDRIAFSGLRGKGFVRNTIGAFHLLAAFGACKKILRKRGVDAVLGMGGYVCFPGGWTARWLGKPLLLVNADASLLLSNKALLPAANRIAFGFAGASADKAGPKAVVTGNPVRQEIEDMPDPRMRFAGRAGALRVLVVGGSLGARVLNECVPLAIGRLKGRTRPHVTHQTGEAMQSAVVAAYRRIDAEAEVLPFIDDIAVRLAECDVIVCRAGAITVSDFAPARQRRLDGVARRSHPPAAGRAHARPAGRAARRHDARDSARDGDQGPRAGAAACRSARGRRDRSDGGCMRFRSVGSDGRRAAPSPAAPLRAAANVFARRHRAP